MVEHCAYKLSNYLSESDKKMSSNNQEITY